MDKVDDEVASGIMALAKLDKDSFRDAIASIISPQQKATIGSVMEAYVKAQSLGSVEEAFQLKSFD